MLARTRTRMKTCSMPPLAARIVGLSGSAYFGSAASVRSVSDAIIRVLGLRLVKNLALGILLSGTFDAGRCKHFSTDLYWGSALLTAGLSRCLAQHAQCECLTRRREPHAPRGRRAAHFFA